MSLTKDHAPVAASSWSTPKSPRSLARDAQTLAQAVARHEMLDCLPSGARCIWVGSGLSSWFVATVGPREFHRALATSCGADPDRAMPWADPIGCLRLLAQSCFSRAGTAPRLLMLESTFHHGFNAAGPEGFGAAAFFTVSPADLEASALALIEGIPGSRRLSARGGPSREALDTSRARSESRKLSILDEPAYFDDPAISVIHQPSILVDSLARPWAIWHPAAARVLGCPPELSVSEDGIRQAISVSSVMVAARRVAMEDPERFEVDFAAAIHPLSSADAVFEIRLLAPVFEARDRVCVLEKATGFAQGASPQTRRL